ncbi:MAG: superoxide dismutase family protein [Burkholderiales bacterium]
MKQVWGGISCMLLLAACATITEQEGPSATAVLQPRSGSQVHGTVKFTQVGQRMRVTGKVWGHGPGNKGFHIHEKGDCSDPKAMSAGGHFNPMKAKHGAPGGGHAGDLGNLVFDQSGKAVIDLMAGGISVGKDTADGIIGRSLIVHMDADDLKTDPTGNAGGRAACGVIG